ncbi:MAG: PepSY domain-containing protein [Bdellovibrionales bacterium]|nr:PepSY domain-containing protein [Bdellovibrionales bacterium]
MKHLIFATLVTLASVSAFAKKNCTDEPKNKWMSEEAFKKKAEDLGYKIRKFKQPGSCYEIYGTNKEGKKVEIYFNPVDGSIVKEEVEGDDEE